jgi:tetratricopeptide (TPR) repeat protein
MKRDNLTPWLLALVSLWSVAGSASAQEVGDSIVIKSKQTSLRTENGSTAAVARGDILGVLKVEPNRFYARLAQGKKGQAAGWVNRGEVWSLSQALEAVINELKREPTAEAYAIRGAIHDALQQYDEALADFDEAIRRDPKEPRVYSDRALTRFAKNNYDGAVADLTEAIRLDPQFATAHVRRAFAWRAKGKFDNALADCDAAQRINPSFAAVHIAKGAVWSSWRQYGLAISECSEAIRLDPNFAIAFGCRAYAWQLKKEYAKALPDYNEVIRLAPKTAIAYLNRGTTYDALEQYDQALADYDAASRLNPKSFSPLLARAWLTATCPEARYRDAKRSLKDAKKACELSEWKEGNCLGALAAANAENGDFLNAVKWQQKAIDLAPENEKQQRAILQHRLTLYKSAQPYHEQRRN